MTFIITALTIILVFVCLLMILVVLMQRPKQEGLGAAFGGGVTDQMFGSQTTNVLQKATVWLAVMFFVLTLAISILMAGNNKQVPNIVNVPAAMSDGDGAAALNTGDAANGGAIKINAGDGSITPAGTADDSITIPATPGPAGDTITIPETPAGDAVIPAEPVETTPADPSN